MSATPRQVVLTGATRGLGRAMAEGFIAEGHVVHGCGRDATQVAELRKRFAAPNTFSVLDVTDAAGISAWAEQVLASGGPPDLLINNAAIINNQGTLWEVPAEEFERLIDININGVVRVIRAFVPAMEKQSKGVIVNFSSGWGRSTSPEVAPYCASKYAIEGLTKALAQELPRGMAAIPLNPGIIDTDMLRSSFGSAAGGYPSAKKWAEKAVPFILALGAQHSGQSLSVPGG